jgi:tetraacyldisaccharide 4'-kinase
MKTIAPIVLPPLSALYGAITRTRLALYQHGTLRSTNLERPVISVGNITAGGTGKTPLVEWIARVVAADGKKVCILTRGYRRENPNQRVLVSDGKSVFSTPAEAGDEAFLLATKLQGTAAVICDANRIAAGEGAIKHLGTDCFVLDDGFQHLRLARDLNVVTIDATDPWGGGSLLPYGRLREPLRGLNRADCFVLTRTDQSDKSESIRAELFRLSGDRPVFLSHGKTIRVAALEKEMRVDNSAKSKRVGAFCAIGNPQSFFRHLRHEGYELVMEKAFRDHHLFRQGDIDAVAAAAKKAAAEFLITTEKDAVKLESLSFEIPCYVLEVEMCIENGQELKQLILSAANKRRSS